MISFPDVEIDLVSYFSSAFAAEGETVKVGTVKTPPDQTQPNKELVINVAYNGEIDFVTRDATATLEVYASSYAAANALGLLVDKLVRGATGSVIKKAEVLSGPLRLPEEGPQERRALDVALIIKGTDN